MKKRQAAFPALLVCASLIGLGAGCGGVDEPSPEPKPREESLPAPREQPLPAPKAMSWPRNLLQPATRLSYKQLDYWGMRLDCYFTVEECREPGKPSHIFHVPFTESFDPMTREALVAGLQRALPDVAVSLDRRSPVVHIVDKRLLGRADSPLDRTRKITFSGSPADLVQRLEKDQADVSLPLGYGFASVSLGGDDVSSVLQVRGFDGPLRRLFTEYLPLSNYRRTLWSAETFEKDGRTRSVVEFRCQRPPIQPKNVGMNRLVADKFFHTPGDFSTGEVAYGYNFGKAECIPAAIRYIEEHLRPGASPLQVRWAMLYLGREKAQAAIPVLVRHVDHLYTPWGVVREAYPAVRALAEVGPEGAAACVARLGYEEQPLRRRLLCQVVLDRHGPEKARQALADAAARAGDAERRGRLREAEKVLAGLAKE